MRDISFLSVINSILDFFEIIIFDWVIESCIIHLAQYYIM